MTTMWGGGPYHGVHADGAISRDGGSPRGEGEAAKHTRQIGKRARTPSPIAIFRFRLPAGQSISRTQLFNLWSAACQTREVSVTRVESASGFGESGHTYSLWGPAQLRCPEVERRLRDSLVAALPKAIIVLTNL